MVIIINIKNYAFLIFKQDVVDNAIQIFLIIHFLSLTAELSGGAGALLVHGLPNSPLKNERKRLPRPSAASG